MNIEVTKFDPTLDYFTGGYLSGFFNSTGVLPLSSDNLSQELGFQVYEDMMCDAKVSKCVNVIKTGVAGDGIELVTPLADTNPEYKISRIVEDFCSYNLKNLQRPLREIVWELLDAVIYGHKIAEITYKIAPYNNKQHMLLGSIKPKPFGSTNFIVDPYFNLLGVSASNILGGKISGKVSLNRHNFELKDGYSFVKLEKEYIRFINRNKFLLLTVNSQNNDPRGRSILRPAYTPWNIKNKVHCEYIRYLVTSASPLLVGFTPENEPQKDDIVIGPDGPLKDANGKIVRINSVQSYRDALLQAKNSGVLAAKGGSKIQSIGGDGAGIAFYKAIEVYDEQIEMAILLQTLATSESRFQSRSASEVHFSTLEQAINHYKLLVADAITEDVLKPLIRYNFGEEYVKYVPKVSFGDTQRRDFATDAAAYAQLWQVGFMDEDQKRHADVNLGLPVRDSESNKIRTVSTEEQLSIRKNTLEQRKLKNESDKLAEERNRLITEQIAALSKAAELSSQSIKSQIEAQIVLLLAKLTVVDTDDIITELAETEKTARDVLRISQDKIYDYPDDVEAGNLAAEGVEVGTNAYEPPNVSGKSNGRVYTQAIKRLLPR